MTTDGYPDPGRPSYCARCGTPVELRERGGRMRPTCPACGWVYYARAALGAAVLVEQDGAILLVQRAHEPFRGQWMLPAGFVEYGEFVEVTARREALEETGLRVSLRGLAGLYFGTDDPRNVAHLAVYRAVIEGGRLEPGDDAADARFFAAEALPPNIAFRSHRAALSDWRRAGGGAPLPEPRA